MHHQAVIAKKFKKTLPDSHSQVTTLM